MRKTRRCRRAVLERVGKIEEGENEGGKKEGVREREGGVAAEAEKWERTLSVCTGEGAGRTRKGGQVGEDSGRDSVGKLNEGEEEGSNASGGEAIGRE
jgi:hypothetical protein